MTMAEITSMMEETRQFPPPKEFVAQAYIKSRQEYETMWKESIENPEKFWGEVASELFWFKKWDKVNEEDFKMPNSNGLSAARRILPTTALTTRSKKAEGTR